MHRGFITLHRKIIEWEWYSDANVFRVFTHLILTANWEPKKWQGALVNRGQKITSIQHMAEETGLTEQSVRTAIKKLKLTGELTTKSTNRYTVLTVVNYGKYQQIEKTATSKSTNEQQTNNKQTTNKQQHRNNVNNVNNVNNTRERERTPVFLTGYYENVRLTEEQVEQLKKDFPKQWDTTLERLSSYIQETGKTYKDHFSVLCRWCKEDSLKAKEKVEVKRTLADRELP